MRSDLQWRFDKLLEFAIIKDHKKLKTILIHFSVVQVSFGGDATYQPSQGELKLDIIMRANYKYQTQHSTTAMVGG